MKRCASRTLFFISKSKYPVDNVITPLPESNNTNKKYKKKKSTVCDSLMTPKKEPRTVLH